MRGKKYSYLFLTAVFLSFSLFIYACSSSSDGGGTAGPPISDTPMTINATTAEAEVEDVVDLVEMQDINDFLGFADLTGSLSFSMRSIGEAVVSRDLSKANLDGFLPVTMGTCPVITVTDIPPGATSFPNPFVISINYSTGCTPPGEDDVYSGSVTLTLTNLSVSVSNQSVSLSSNYSLVFNDLTTNESVMNGSVAGRFTLTADTGGSSFSGSLTAVFTNFTDGEDTLNGSIGITLTNVLVNDLTGQLTGTVSVTFTNFSNGSDTLNGTVSVLLDVDIFTEIGTMTITYTNFTDGTETLTGTLTVTTTSTSVTLDYALSTSQGPIDMTVIAVIDDLAGTMTINTVGTGVYQGVNITITDVVISDSCSASPISGTIVLSDATDTATITFGGCGVVNVVIT